jgi:hypothetical protein
MFSATRPHCRRPPPAAASLTLITRPQSLDVAIPHDASLSTTFLAMNRASTAYSCIGSPSKNLPPENVSERYGTVFEAMSIQF